MKKYKEVMEMRLWHYKLIKILPRQQLVSQWRECCGIMKHLSNKGTPNHLLVNKILDYPLADFNYYCEMIVDEIIHRGYKVSTDAYHRCIANYKTYFKMYQNINIATWYSADYFKEKNTDNIFDEWHTFRYLRECVYNLEEKAMCGGIPKEEWEVIYNKYKDTFDLWHEEI